MRGIHEIDFSDLTNWKSGTYHWETGEYMDYPSRLCLIDYVRCQSETEYTVRLNSIYYRVLIRELDINFQLINSHVLQVDDYIITKANTYYLAVGLYSQDNSKLTYDDYVKLFKGGFNLTIHEENEDQTKFPPEDVKNYQLVEDVDFSKFTSWRSGGYSLINGAYERNNYRLCLDNYKIFENKSYKVKINNQLFRLLIRELDKNMKFLRSYNLANGELYTPSGQVKYLAIGIYREEWETNLNYATYKVMFQNGFYAGLEKDPPDIITPPKTLYEALKNMLETGDMSVRDISKYQVNYVEFNQVYQKLIKGESYLAYQTYYSMYPTTTENSSGILKTVNLKGSDVDFVSRYKKLKEVVADVKSLLKSEMKDIEKALVFHDYLVEHTTYDTNAVGAHTPSGVLVNGRGLCDGYTMAFNLLLHEVGITSYYLGSSKMNHSWNMIMLDGALYHADATWDDTRTRKWNYTDHTFFIRNDNEFKNPANLNNSHHSWVSYTFDATSTSTKYVNWFVHDVIGKILYKDGNWYYGSGNNLVKSKIDGSQMAVVKTESSSIQLVSIENGIITYYVNGVKKTIQ